MTNNKELAQMFSEIALMLGIEDRPNSRFEVRAYQNAALLLDTLEEDVAELYGKGGLPALLELQGIGKTMASHIVEFITSGKIGKYEELKKRYPIDFKNLTRIEGLGPKRIAILYQKLGVQDVDGLRKALAEHRIRGLEGFGEKSESLIEKGLGRLESSKGRILLGDALPVAEALVAELKRSGLVGRIEIAGSAKRMRETVGDLDILAISEHGEEVMDIFTGFREVSGIVVKGPTKSTVWLKLGITCDLRVINSKAKNFGAALQYFTGSKDHNVNVRKIAMAKGYKLNEYGLFDRKGKELPCGDEETLYERLGLQVMPPEMRENRGEIELAKEHRIPRLVELADLRGDLHTHTSDSDGSNTIEEMAQAAIARGFEYFATTNHTKSLGIAHGLDEKRFAKFFRKVDALNEKLEGKIRILKGAEVDILKNGDLDLNDRTLESMDMAVGAVHSAFNMPKAEMTKRVVKAMESGHLHVLAHPTGRLINKREGFAIDLDKVAEAAERNHVAMEIDSYPDRLDLNDTNVMRLSKYKILFSIDSDAHRKEHFNVLRYGVGTARRGWLTKDRVLNTKTLKELAGAIRK